MFVHEYSNKKFKTFDECVEDLREYIEEDDIVQNMDLTLTEVVSSFLRNRNNVDFSVWFQQKIDEATILTEDEFITEYEDEEEDEDDE